MNFPRIVNKKRLIVRPGNIPKKMKKYNQWIGWHYEEKINKKGDLIVTKVPKNITKSFPASTKKPEHWCDFETCIKYLNFFHGIGFVITLNDPFVIWDIDDCCNYDTGDITIEAQKLIKKLNSYTEYSPSGKGLRVVVKGELSGPVGRRNRSKKIEVYDSRQYVTMTGHHLKGTPNKIMKRRKLCIDLHKRIFRKQILNKQNRPKNLAELDKISLFDDPID